LISASCVSSRIPRRVQVELHLLRSGALTPRRASGSGATRHLSGCHCSLPAARRGAAAGGSTGVVAGSPTGSCGQGLDGSCGRRLDRRRRKGLRPKLREEIALCIYRRDDGKARWGKRTPFWQIRQVRLTTAKALTYVCLVLFVSSLCFQRTEALAASPTIMLNVEEMRSVLSRLLPWLLRMLLG